MNNSNIHSLDDQGDDGFDDDGLGAPRAIMWGCLFTIIIVLVIVGMKILVEYLTHGGTL